jgi:threonine dehydrogenase-like Zn-dependent dehydrogenase
LREENVLNFAVLTKPYQFEMEDRSYPELKDRDLLITVKKVGICGSEIAAYQGTHKYRIPPVILGHEMTGSVTLMGREVSRFRIGDRVVVKPHTYCGQCPDCLNGNQNICKEKIVLGSREWPGAFGEFIISPEHLVHHIPESISDEEAALLDPLCVGLHAVRMANVQAGDRVAILGAGSIGLSTLLVTKATGAETYITDVKTKNLHRAREIGAKETFDVSVEMESRRLNKLAEDIRLDAVFVTAGVENTVSHALKIVRRGGQVVVIAHFHNPIIPLDMFNLMTQGKKVQGSIVYTGEDLERGIQLLAQKKVDVRLLISEQRSLGEIQSCFERLMAGEEGLIKILLNP